ncbi:hypothetical protein A9Q99_18035 [Gammaproteobacteria bacterium 45_16_T64]|nr:hypothetical protein A9Q99_18035 [Gammaproteobacteria bacterium 45_16_T64]
MTTTYQVAIEVAEGVIEYLEDKGIDAKAYMKTQGWEYDEHKDEGFVPFSIVSDMFDWAEQLTGDVYIGLHVGEKTQARHWGRLGYLILVGDDGLESLEYIQRYAQLITNVMDVQFENGQAGDGDIICRFEMKPETFSRHACEYFLSAVYSLSKMFSDNKFLFKSLSFKHALPVDKKPIEDSLECPCEFLARENKVVAYRESLQFSSSYRDPRMKKILRDHAEMVIKSLSQDDDLIDSIRNYVIDKIADGAPTLTMVAQEFGVNERSLQRTLAKHEITFQELVDELRMKLAKSYIRDGYTFLDTALLLGYSEQSSFHRAFKRWTGMSPSLYKKGLV